MTDNPEKILRNNIWINATTSVVFKAISDGKEIVKWFPDAEAKIVPKIGGDVLFKWKDGSVLKSSIQKYVEYKEISYGFYGGDKEPVTFFIEAENNGTRVKLDHLIPAGSPMGGIDDLINISSSWTYLLVALKCSVEKQYDIREPSKIKE